MDNLAPQTASAGLSGGDETTVNGTPSALQDYEWAVDKIQEALGYLLKLKHELVEAGGVSRAHVKVLTEECGVQFPATAPINSFTQSPSPTNLTVANESILTAAVEKAKELGHAIMELLRKIFRWIVDQLNRLRGLLPAKERGVEKIRAVTGAVQKMDELGVAQMDVAPSATPRVRQLQEKLRGIEEQFSEQFNDLMGDALQGNVIASNVRALLLYLPNIVDAYHLQVMSFTRAAEVTRKNIDRTQAAQLGAYTSAASQEPWPILNRLADKIAPQEMRGQDRATLPQVANILQTRLRELSQTRSFEAPSLKAVGDNLDISKTQLGVSPYLNDRVLVKASETVFKSLADATKAIEGRPVQISPEISQAEANALRSIRENGSAIRALITLGVYIDQAQNQLIDAMFNWWSTDYAIYVERANSADEDTKTKAKAVHMDLAKRLR